MGTGASSAGQQYIDPRLRDPGNSYQKILQEGSISPMPDMFMKVLQLTCGRLLPREMLIQLMECFTLQKLLPQEKYTLQEGQRLVVLKGVIDIMVRLQYDHPPSLLSRRREGSVICQMDEAELLQEAVYAREKLEVREDALIKALHHLLGNTWICSEKGAEILKLDLPKYRALCNLWTNENKRKRLFHDHYLNWIRKVFRPYNFEDLPFLQIAQHILPHELLLLNLACVVLVKKPGEVISMEKHHEDGAYVLLEGELEIFMGISEMEEKKNEKSRTLPSRFAKPQALKTMTPTVIYKGEWVGEVTSIGAIKTPITLRAVKESLLCFIDSSTYQNFMRLHPRAEDAMTRTLKRYLVQRCLEFGNVFFAYFQRGEELDGVISCFSVKQFMPGSFIVRQGERPRALWVLCDGTLLLNREGENCRVMERGGMFGCLVNKKNHMEHHTIIAMTEATFLVCEQSCFQELATEGGKENVDEKWLEKILDAERICRKRGGG